jgi:tetratricopeptide (TPR) repeat protein
LIHGFENPGFTKYGFFTFVFGVAIVLANKFLRVHNEVEELNESLERKVERRTEQLQNSLNDIRELKYQQDGDYFLTTLLIKPLMENKGFGENVNIEFYVKQKKTFEFKKKIYEIGGDICIANKIRLKDKEYTVFINGDAMGKSIQGAGGALVLGVVFRAVVSRTQMGIQRESMPEIWLKHCFMELQNVFVSFDGTMLISIVMGLIEDEKGMLYFINAEHPWSVLYRDGKASFIENQLYIRKIGMLGMEGQVKIQTFQLQSGDSIIIGSDGRDDILISVNEDGHRIINEDEANFLRCVEKGNGSLPEITKEILKLGEFTDDFTLLKASYTSQKSVLEDENFESEVYENLVKLSESNYETDAHKFLEYACKAIEMNPENTDLFKKVIKIFHNLKDYQNTIVYLEKYHQIRPDDTEQMVSLSYHYKLVGKLKLSVDYGESIRLREPKLVRNLVNLADVYRLQDLIPRANKILNEALNIDSTNKKALELLNYMEKKMHKGSHEETRQ